MNSMEKAFVITLRKILGKNLELSFGFPLINSFNLYVYGRSPKMLT
jgi:hypothetical protein